jgi:hypothetical protein
MSRWIPEDHKTILQLIADDERRPAHEREAARRELAAPVAQSAPSAPRRRGRNSNAPQTQQDIDSGVENWYLSRVFSVMAAEWAKKGRKLVKSPVYINNPYGRASQSHMQD